MFNKIIRFATSLLIIALCSSACSNSIINTQIDNNDKPQNNISETEQIKTTREPISIGSLNECMHYNEKDFNCFISNAESYECYGKIICGVVPHHLLAGKMIASFFKTVSENRDDVETVVIVAPIHEPKLYDIVTTSSNWKTPTGVLGTDKDITQYFVDGLGAVNDNETVQNDHSASALIPFVSNYFPSAEVSCLLISGVADKNTPEKIEKLLSVIDKEKNCLFVFSIDFSHYLVPEETQKHDIETRKAIFDFDMETIMKMGNSNLDTPYGACTFLRLVQSLNAEIIEFDHSNSLEISDTPYSPTLFREGLTSYFIYGGINNK